MVSAAQAASTPSAAQLNSSLNVIGSPPCRAILEPATGRCNTSQLKISIVKTTAPPDPNTRKPKFKPPPLACDAHCHVFGPAAKFPYAPDAPYWPPDSPFEALQALHGK